MPCVELVSVHYPYVCCLLQVSTALCSDVEELHFPAAHDSRAAFPGPHKVCTVYTMTSG
jgi:hypothetical protein